MKKLEDYINEQKGNGEVAIVWSYEWYGMMNMVEDLASHIEELEKDNGLLRGEINRIHKKVDFVTEHSIFITEL